MLPKNIVKCLQDNLRPNVSIRKLNCSIKDCFAHCILLIITFFWTVGLLKIFYICHPPDLEFWKHSSFGVTFPEESQEKDVTLLVDEATADEMEVQDYILVGLMFLQCLIVSMFLFSINKEKLRWYLGFIPLICVIKVIFFSIFMLPTKERIQTFNIFSLAKDHFIQNPNLINETFLEHYSCCGVDSYKDYTRANMPIPRMCLCNCTLQEDYDLKKIRYEDEAYNSSSESNSEEMVTEPPYLNLRAVTPQNICNDSSKSYRDRGASFYDDDTGNRTREANLNTTVAYQNQEWQERPNCVFQHTNWCCYNPSKVNEGLIVNSDSCWKKLEELLVSRLLSFRKSMYIAMLVIFVMQLFLYILLIFCRKFSKKP